MKVWRQIAAAAVAGTVFLCGGMTALAEVGPGVRRASGIAVEQMEAAKDRDRLLVVVGTGMDSSQVQVAYFKKDENGSWDEEFYVSGCCGYSGMTETKKEGDRRTPVGTYQFTTAFGILADPGSKIPYHQLDESDYWVDDSESAYYNQMVSTKNVTADWNSAEHLIGVNPCYNYSLALNYNADCVPGAGSAIFLHVTHPVKTWTEGCIAIPQDAMEQVMKEADEQTAIVIAPDASWLPAEA